MREDYVYCDEARKLTDCMYMMIDQMNLTASMPYYPNGATIPPRTD